MKVRAPFCCGNVMSMANDNDKGVTFTGVMYNIGTVLLTFILAVLGSLVMAWCAQVTWHLFVERDLGVGPSLAGWYGISTLVHLLMMSTAVNLKRRENTNSRWDTLGLVVALTVGSLLTLGSSWCAGKILGWI